MADDIEGVATRVLGLIEGVEKRYGKPVVTSTQASMWVALRGRVSPRGDDFGELMRKL